MSPAPTLSFTARRNVARLSAPRQEATNRPRSSSSSSEHTDTSPISRPSAPIPISIPASSDTHPTMSRRARLPIAESETEDDSEADYDDMPELVPVSVSSWYEEDYILRPRNPTAPNVPVSSSSRPMSVTTGFAPPVAPVSTGNEADARYAWAMPPRVIGNADESLQNRIRTISRYYVDWLSNVQSLQNRYVDTTPAHRGEAEYLSRRERALSELNRTLAETESLTARLGTLASDLEANIEQNWPATESPCLYPGMTSILSSRRWNFNRRTSAVESGSDADYEGMLRDGRVDKNGCEVVGWNTEGPTRHMMEADR